MALGSHSESRLRPVSSPQNALVKELRKAFSQSGLTEEGLVAIEGVRILEEAIRSGLRFQAVFFSESGRAHAQRLLPQISSQTEVLLLPDAVFSSAVDTETPQGVAAMVRPKIFRLEEVLQGADENLLIIGLAGVQDPGNVGTVIRSAEAFLARAVLLGEKTASHFNSKVVRASAGSVFRQPVVRLPLIEAATSMKERGLRVVATSSHKGKPAAEIDLTGPLALLIGNEGAGLPTAVVSMADELVTIPHSPRVESLNAAIAASILLYEAAKNRMIARDPVIG
ncbi:MAG TPA: RNA methyltransferase [Candidatus Angelobacter sp.]